MESLSERSSLHVDLREGVGPREAGTHDRGISSSKHGAQWPQRDRMLIDDCTYESCADDDRSDAGDDDRSDAGT